MALRLEVVQDRPKLKVINGGIPTNGLDRIRKWTQTAGSIRPDGTHSLTGTIIEGPEHELFSSLSSGQREAVLEDSIAVVDIYGQTVLRPRAHGKKYDARFQKIKEFEREEKARSGRILDPNGDHHTLGLPLVSAVYEAEHGFLSKEARTSLGERLAEDDKSKPKQRLRGESVIFQVRSQIDDVTGLGIGRNRKQTKIWLKG